MVVVLPVFLGAFVSELAGGVDSERLPHRGRLSRRRVREKNCAVWLSVKRQVLARYRADMDGHLVAALLIAALPDREYRVARAGVFEADDRTGGDGPSPSALLRCVIRGTGPCADGGGSCPRLARDRRWRCSGRASRHAPPTGT